jgi:tetratricopeptide (TPR) repeat protein
MRKRVYLECGLVLTEIRHFKGIALGRLGKYNESLIYYIKALAIDPRPSVIYNVVVPQKTTKIITLYKTPHLVLNIH